MNEREDSVRGNGMSMTRRVGFGLLFLLMLSSVKVYLVARVLLVPR